MSDRDQVVLDVIFGFLLDLDVLGDEVQGPVLLHDADAHLVLVPLFEGVRILHISF